MKGIHLRVPEAFAKDKRIKSSQLGPMILVFGSMWSFTGKGNVCYASVGFGPNDKQNPKTKNKEKDKATLCSRSGLSKNTVIKYKKLLKQLGWISVKREGRGLNDTMLLHEIALIEPTNKNPNVCDTEGKNLGIEVFKNTNAIEGSSGGVPQGDGFAYTESSIEPIKRIEGKHWDIFIRWGRERLTRSSIRLLEEAIIKEQDGSLIVRGRIPESIGMIVHKYFVEELKFPNSVIIEQIEEESKAA
ncbi:helix-turn-helix domain-containing protein [Leptospira gomenensis]|uniref:Helix-turn-helix domain-containing protein n=1 Tax=Leptospira gomenensis TaxID=2484974 RepID=A0A5F1YEZ9_9LEPT|nr:helix-turn-helix domain-containing protein [Leptospira gomenensis]TGK36208.1 helix-turn-helix domain-containing protein [Leptospira gomenensis]TGK42754.1 helix-turn-helix domain-containing protein [Leptospira gomenensis]TGK42941.1 helix-turn-helix domain-containing protein [Leptospira gomenensis]TGK54953.1 helix-turn-helix domain-containing protein [Leptospira gomenensis]